MSNELPRVVDGVLTYSTYYCPRDGLMVLRKALEPDHPENLYNHLKSHGITPEDFGVEVPLTEEEMEIIGKSKEWLTKELLKAWKYIAHMERNGF